MLRYGMAQDQAPILRDFLHAERHVTEGHGRIANQRKIIADLERLGYDTTTVRAQLADLLEVQAAHEAKLVAVLETLSENNKFALALRLCEEMKG
jgi:hypothetical protein